MSPLGTVIVAWAAVYAYVCVYFGNLYLRRRKARVYLSFGLLAGSLSVYAVGAALLHEAASFEQSVVALRVKGVGLTAGVAFTVDFCHRLVNRTDLRAVRAAYAWALVALALVVSGLALSDSASAPVPTWGFASAPDYPEPALTPVGHVLVISAWALVGYCVALLVPQAPRDRDVRVILGSVVVNVAAGAHDVFIHIASLRSLYLIEHSTMLSIVAMSYLLLDRYVRTSEQLTARTLELRSSYDELRHTQEELVHKEQLAAVGELSAVIAHEVRNPLAIIKNSVSGLRRVELDPGDRSTLLSILDEELDRLNRLVSDLLAYARPVSLQGRVVPLEDLIRRSIDLARSAIARAADFDLHVELGAAPGSVHGDPDLLRHAFVNIVENAIQAMPGTGRLSVEAGPTQLGGESAVRIDFHDTGEGMDTVVRSKALDPFFTTRPTGTGLGLAIVERVVRMHGGRVEIESRHGRGTTVSVILPVDRPATNPLTTPSPRPAASGV